MSYESQLKKWGAKHYKIAGKDIDEVTLSVESYCSGVGNGCCCGECYCSYGPESTMESRIVVYGLPDARGKRKVLKTETVEIGWQNEFSVILKEIIEA